MSDTTKTIVVASHNPVKVAAALQGFRKMFPDQAFRAVSVSVASGVPDQPMTDAETLAGAMNRVKNAAAEMPEADYWIGIEGGVDAHGEDLTSFAWVVIQAGEVVGKAKSGVFFLPPAVAHLIAQGMELGHADDVVFRKQNSKQETGAIGLLTHNVVDRQQLYEQAVVLALVRFRNEALYSSPGPVVQVQ